MQFYLQLYYMKHYCVCSSFSDYEPLMLVKLDIFNILKRAQPQVLYRILASVTEWKSFFNIKTVLSKSIRCAQKCLQIKLHVFQISTASFCYDLQTFNIVVNFIVIFIPVQ